LGRPVLRGGGAGDYFTLRDEDRFEMRRPQWAPRQADTPSSGKG
jgi:hypothetical protein